MSGGRPESGPLIHHELCFGCGRQNLFGLLAELEAAGAGRVAGRCFLKQDHQGAQPGTAHDGVIATALSEAMRLARGAGEHMRTLEVRFEEPVPVGSFLALDATGESATASVDGRAVASARASWG